MSYGGLRPGASCDPESYQEAWEQERGPTPLEVRRIADRVEAETRLTGGAPSTTPLEGGRSGVPQGYGKYGDSA